MENVKQNWFIGVRTPWTLTSESVWNKTNRLAGKLFKVAGVLAALGMIFPEYAILLILLPVILTAIYPIIYSYFLRSVIQHFSKNCCYSGRYSCNDGNIRFDVGILGHGAGHEKENVVNMNGSYSN